MSNMSKKKKLFQSAAETEPVAKELHFDYEHGKGTLTFATKCVSSMQTITQFFELLDPKAKLITVKSDIHIVAVYKKVDERWASYAIIEGDKTDE